jgi:hypothetical protein
MTGRSLQGVVIVQRFGISAGDNAIIDAVAAQNFRKLRLETP